MKLRLLIAGLLAVAAAASALAAYRSFYRAPLTTIEDDIAAYADDAARYRDDAIRFADMAAPLTAFAERTIAGDAETIESDLRAILNRLADRAGLAAVRTQADASRPAVNPASTGRLGEFRPPDGRGDAEFASFVPVDASISGTGTLEQALTAVALLESQPWPKRFSGVSIQPDSDRQRATVRVEFQTIYLPDMPPPGDRPDIAPVAPEMRERINRILAARPFSPPAPKTKPAPEPTPKPAPKPAPAPPPYADWYLTALTETDAGPAAWLRNRRSGEVRTLNPGGSIFELTLERVEGSAAVFARDDARHTVPLGGTLPADP